MSIYHPVNKYFNMFDFNILHGVNGNDPGGGISTRSDVTCHKCDKKGHTQRDFKPNKNGFGGNASNNPTIELP